MSWISSPANGKVLFTTNPATALYLSNNSATVTTRQRLGYLCNRKSLIALKQGVVSDFRHF